MAKRPQKVGGMTSGTVKADETLVRRLHEAAKRTLTKEEVQAQRVSFIYGNMPQDSSISRADVAAAVAKIDGEAA